MEKKAKAEAKRKRRISRKQDGVESISPESPDAEPETPGADPGTLDGSN
ncbi:MAG: hypothetical protein IID46_07875 [Planctomycetes bacterium]|nr:hypothetical protein [Planctomycetota bacterium]